MKEKVYLEEVRYQISVEKAKPPDIDNGKVLLKTKGRPGIKVAHPMNLTNNFSTIVASVLRYKTTLPVK